MLKFCILFYELIALPFIKELTESRKPQESFTKGHYRQPIPTEKAHPFLSYQRGQQDKLTSIALIKLGFIDKDDIEEASSPNQAPYMITKQRWKKKTRIIGHRK